MCPEMAKWMSNTQCASKIEPTKGFGKQGKANQNQVTQKTGQPRTCKKQWLATKGSQKGAKRPSKTHEKYANGLLGRPSARKRLMQAMEK